MLATYFVPAVTGTGELNRTELNCPATGDTNAASVALSFTPVVSFVHCHNDARTGCVGSTDGKGHRTPLAFPSLSAVNSVPKVYGVLSLASPMVGTSVVKMF